MKRYSIEGPDWDYIEDSGDGDWVLWESYKELLKITQDIVTAWDSTYPSMKWDGDIEELENMEFRQINAARRIIAEVENQK